jgi:tRNA-2-methylthio-N6-dimethylallyladenosine synthase
MEPVFEITDKTHDESRQGEVFTDTLPSAVPSPNTRKFYIESYGCAMNFSDSEIVASIPFP